MKKHKDYRGFTIIEVVLVLAIAGLIFLMIFLALPALQRSQRDTQRKNDARNLLAAIIEFQSHNKGRRPFNDGNNAWTKLKPYWNKSNLLNDRPPGHIDDFAFFNSKTETIVEYSKLGSAWHPAGDWNIVLGALFVVLAIKAAIISNMEVLYLKKQWRLLSNSKVYRLMLMVVVGVIA